MSEQQLPSEGQRIRFTEHHPKAGKTGTVKAMNVMHGVPFMEVHVDGSNELSAVAHSYQWEPIITTSCGGASQTP